MKKNKWTYAISWSYKVNGKKVSALTQLYQVGVYCIYDNDPSMQMNLTPSQIQSNQAKLKAGVKKGEIKDLVFGPSITVTDESGLFCEVE